VGSWIVAFVRSSSSPTQSSFFSIHWQLLWHSVGGRD
jgi:hypothetical protein